MTITELLDSLVTEFVNENGEFFNNVALTGWTARRSRCRFRKEEWDYLLARNWYWTSKVKRSLQGQFPTALLFHSYLSSDSLLVQYLTEFPIQTYGPSTVSSSSTIKGILLEELAIVDELLMKLKYKDLSNYLLQLRLKDFTNYLVEDCNINNLLVPCNYLKTTSQLNQFLSQLSIAGWEMKQPVLLNGNKILNPTTADFVGKLPNLLYCLIHR